MKLNNLKNNKVSVNLYIKERLINDPFVCQKIIKVNGVHRFEKKYYMVKDIEECINSAETLSELLKDTEQIEVVVEIYLDVNDNDYYNRMDKSIKSINKSVKLDRITKRITNLLQRFI